MYEMVNPGIADLDTSLFLPNPPILAQLVHVTMARTRRILPPATHPLHSTQRVLLIIAAVTPEAGPSPVAAATAAGGGEMIRLSE